MKRIVFTYTELCEGCNRCVRVCPVETANIAYQDDSGDIKVKVDEEKCIACGLCISACKHKAREYSDDIDKFFNDIKSGVSISLIAAPAIRINIPKWKNLFTYLKRLGVKKIYDVSLGADICVWAHLRYVAKNNKPIITQPCPAIVSYCEKYRKELLEYLSPVHSPMACTAIYMRRYENINDKIAALSPCIGKTNEFDDIGVINYNVTFKKLHEYIEACNIKLPDEETDFDHYESGLGSIFSMPGGLKENVEFFTGKSIRIDKSEGQNIYKNLDTFAKTKKDLLPQIYDVLNCAEGCNAGSGCIHDKSVFEIDTVMEKCKKAATKDRDLDYYVDLFAKYDKTFNLSHYLRKYKRSHLHLSSISEKDISNSFVLLGKTNYEKSTP